MKGRKRPNVKDVRTMLLCWNRTSRFTAQPRADVCVSPAEREAEVYIQGLVQGPLGKVAAARNYGAATAAVTSLGRDFPYWQS